MADPELLATVRDHNRDRYLAALFAPDDKRDSLLALYAFDVEIARIPSLVSEPQLGEIRLQWWRDTVAALYAQGQVDHPLAQQLGTAIRQGALPEHSLQAVIDARSRELYADPMPSLNDLEGYLGETRSAVLQMAAQILSDGKGQGLADAAGFGGVALGITELLEVLPRLPHGGKHLLPDMETAALLDHVEKRLRDYANASQSLDAKVRPAFLPLATLAARLRKLRRKGVGHSISPLRAQWLIWQASRSG